jgi:hypothetical protein
VFPSTRSSVFCCFAQFRTRCPFTLHVFVPVNRFRVSVHALDSILLFRTVPHALPVHVTRFRPRSRVARSRSRVARSRYTFSSPFSRFRPRAAQFSAVSYSSARVARSRYTFSSRVTVLVFPSMRCPVFCCSAEFRTRCPFTLHVFVPVNRFRVSVHALPNFLLFRTVPHVLPVHVTRSQCCPFTFTCCLFTLHVFVPVNRFRVSVHALPSFLLFRTVPHALPVHVTRFRPG